MSPPHLSASFAGAAAVPAGAREMPVVFSLLDEMPAGVILLDGEGVVTYLNAIAELRLDRPKSEVVGVDFFRAVLPALDLEGLGARYRAAMRAGRVALATETAAAVEGGMRRLHIGIRSFDAVGSLVSMVLLEDRSSLAREEERRRWAERLAAVGELAAGVAHEVNNPLASIKSFAQLLARDAAIPEQCEALRIIDDEATRIAQAIDQLMGFARQQEVCEAELTDFGTIVSHVLGLRRYALKSAGVDIEVELDAESSPVRGEVGALQRLALHLLTRAERSLGGRGEGRRLRVRLREASDGVILRVADNGPGLTRDDLAVLFEEPTPGLCTAATIVRDHGGHIWAESALERGTAVYVRLPRAEQELPPAAAEPGAPVLATVVTGLRVLVADDEPTLRLAVALFLRRHGHEVVEASNANDAFALAGEREFDVALVDARMPGDGVALVEKLQRIPKLRGRTILMSGDSRHVATAAGDDPDFHFVAKPFEMTEIVHLVERLGR